MNDIIRSFLIEGDLKVVSNGMKNMFQTYFHMSSNKFGIFEY